jgi:hypothetical protein
MFLLLCAIFALRIPSFFEPFSYGDEMIYLSLGEAIRRGMTLYKDIHDNKPPLIYFLAALSGNVFWFRAILASWMMATTILFWKLTLSLFPKRLRLQQASVVVFAILTTLPLLEGQTSNSELFMLAPTISAFLILFSQKSPPIKIFLAGVLFSFATLFKVPAAFDVGAIVFFWFITLKSSKSLPSTFSNLFLLILGFLLPIAFSAIWYFHKAALPEYLVAAFLQNVGYLSSWRPTEVQEPFLVKNAPLIARGLVVLFGSFSLYVFRKHLSKPFIFASLWLLFSLFAATLSERPYPHYLIQIVPPVSLLTGILLTKSTLEQSLSVIPLSLAALVPVYYHFWYYPTAPYYQRFIQFASRSVSREEYFDKFDTNVNRNYRIANFLTCSSKRNDPIFVWGESSPVYALSRRLPPLKYIATYHIIDFSSQEEVLQTLTQNKPAFIIILPQSPAFPSLAPLLDSNYLLIENIDGAKIWKLVNPTITRRLLR